MDVCLSHSADNAKKSAPGEMSKSQLTPFGEGEERAGLQMLACFVALACLSLEGLRVNE